MRCPPAGTHFHGAIPGVGCTLWPDAQRAAAQLEELGGTPDEVAAALKARRIQGSRHAVRLLNPVVRFIRRRIVLDADSLDVIQGDKLRFTFWDGGTVEAPIPKAVRLFMDAFDSGKYPELELLPECA